MRNDVAQQRVRASRPNVIIELRSQRDFVSALPERCAPIVIRKRFAGRLQAKAFLVKRRELAQARLIAAEPLEREESHREMVEKTGAVRGAESPRLGNQRTAGFADHQCGTGMFQKKFAILTSSGSGTSAPASLRRFTSALMRASSFASSQKPWHAGQ